MHTIYESISAWTINADSSHPHQKEITNYLYVPKGHERLISPQNWAQKTTSSNADATNMDVTRCVTHHDHATLIWGGGR